MSGMIDVGIVGCGNISKAHTRSYAKLEQVKITAVCDIDNKRAEQVAGEFGAAAYTDLETMLKEQKIDAASVCTPPFLHREQVEVLLERRVHVLCEKPLSHTVDDAKAMAKAAEDAGCILMTGFCWRFHGIRREIKKRIDEGAVGEVKLVTFHGGGLAKHLEGGWFGDPGKGGGIVREASVHFFDQIRWLAGEIKDVQARTATLSLNMEAEDTILATFGHENGACSVISFSWGTPGASPLLEINGSTGTITESGHDTAVLRTINSEKVETFTSGSDEDRFAGEVAHFIQAVRGEESPQITPHDGVRATEIAIAVLESASTGRIVEV